MKAFMGRLMWSFLSLRGWDGVDNIEFSLEDKLGEDVDDIDVDLGDKDEIDDDVGDGGRFTS